MKNFLLCILFTSTSLAQAQGTLFIIVGAPGVGKTTLVKKAVESYEHKLKLESIMQYVTRPIRLFEKQGEDYNFVSSQEFEKLKKNNLLYNDFIVNFRGYLYAPPYHTVQKLEDGVSCLLISGYHQAPLFKLCKPDCVIILITCNRMFAEKRLSMRGTEPKELQERLAYFDLVVEKELQAPCCDYTIINNDLIESWHEFETILKRHIISPK